MVDELDAFNNGAPIEETQQGNAVTFTSVAKVVLFQMQKGPVKDQEREFIQITLEAKDPQGNKFTSMKKQMLNRNSDGKLKNWIYPGGESATGTIYPSLAYQIAEGARAYMGETKYNGIKDKFGDGKLNRLCFENMELELEFKKVTAKESGTTFYMAMFAYDKAQDLKYKEEHSKKEDEDSIDPSGLPF